MSDAREKRRDYLISVLLDPSIDDAVRDDAAMDLGDEFEDDVSLRALIQVALSVRKEDDMVLNSCGEGIGTIWGKRNFFDMDLYSKCPTLVRHGIYIGLKANNQELLERHDLKLDKT